nr:MAG TPA: hypothetical protein [Caudoviricetes sp.]
MCSILNFTNDLPIFLESQTCKTRMRRLKI